jgi:hypothetical protein
MERKVRPVQDHPSPHHGVEGSWGDSTEQVTPPQPCPPASSSGIVGRSIRQAGPQQLHMPPHSTPSRTVPTWADIARGGISTHQATATSPADAIALCKRYVTMGFQARFLIKSNAGHEDIILFCRFPASLVASHIPTQPTRSRRNRPLNCGKPTTCSPSVQTEPSACTSPSHPHRTASPPPLTQAASPTAPPPAKKMRKCRCELELLKDDDNEHHQSVPISPPAPYPTSPSGSPSSSPSLSSLTPS